MTEEDELVAAFGEQHRKFIADTLANLDATGSKIRNRRACIAGLIRKAAGPDHCFHDHGTITAVGYETHGQSVCCQCGLTTPWHTERVIVPGHGPFFSPSTSFRVWDEPVGPCRQPGSDAAAPNASPSQRVENKIPDEGGST